MQSKHAPCEVLGRYLPSICGNAISPAISHWCQVEPQHAIVDMIGRVPCTSVPLQNKVISPVLAMPTGLHNALPDPPIPRVAIEGAPGANTAMAPENPAVEAA